MPLRRQLLSYYLLCAGSHLRDGPDAAQRISPAVQDLRVSSQGAQHRARGQTSAFLSAVRPLSRPVRVRWRQAQLSRSPAETQCSASQEDRGRRFKAELRVKEACACSQGQRHLPSSVLCMQLNSRTNLSLLFPGAIWIQGTSPVLEIGRLLDSR